MKAQFNQASINRMLEKRLEGLHNAVFSRLQLIGLEFVRNAREFGEYNDITGNLRSSIGFLILKDGQIVENNFQAADKGTDRATGMARGQALAEELAARHSAGYVLIVVAGMEYAASVESKGKDVLTGSSLTAETQLQEAIQAIGAKIR
ncbi:hypothetical protein AHMF7605_11805 [Adhaeribacter arboris]|uniref:Uncharacterized protein n=1 Tax=Adhaeribacter arboris TaxID=2072846 RepID=A0A2T2YF57_9BACT|nr:hypothetical protein [Adhaeribacter arboris]PSR54156.1 hypothetical protein AHMF7605_11805 [Adhaeribacter arboris]